MKRKTNFMHLLTLLLIVSIMATTQGVTAFAEAIDESTVHLDDNDGISSNSIPEGTPANPVHYCNKEDGTQDTTTWSYVYFGSYPQSEVVDKATKQAIDSAISQGKGQSAGTAESSEGIDVWVGDTKYRRISEDDTNYSGYFDDMLTSNGCCYFRWERIKWRVLKNDGSTLFVVADKAIDCKDYNEEYKSVTWEDSTIRGWLNASFYNTAFSSSEQSAIVTQNVVTENNPEYGTEGGSNTSDKVYLLSISEVTDEAYGFCSDYNTYSASRWVQLSNYAHARGTYSYNSSSIGGKDNCRWWLRSPGDGSYYAADVDGRGYVNRAGRDVDNYNDGICPALHINLSSGIWCMADDGASGEGGNGNGDREEEILKDLKVSKGKTEYVQGEELNLNDLTITVVYENSTKILSKASYTVDKARIDMNVPGSYLLWISYAEGGITKEASIAIIVEEASKNIPEGTPENPVHHCNKEDGTQDTTTWSYVYFGSYPQSDVTDSATIAAIDNAIATSGTVADVGMDVWVNGTKYRRISKDNTIGDGVTSIYNEYFDEVPNNGYRYFKWERMKWKVLENDGNTLFVIADKIIDLKDYNEGWLEDITWETSPLRKWLNIDFYDTAFSKSEQSAIEAQTVVNEGKPEYGIEGGNDTNDKVYLLSISEVINEAYGFCSDYDAPSTSRRVKASDYADARGAHNYDGTFLWWLRSTGPYSRYHASEVDSDGRLPRPGYGTNYVIDGVCPVLHITLSSNLWLIADDGTSGEGGNDNGDREEEILKDLQVSKAKTEYVQGEELNVNDLIVTAVYGNSSKVLPAGSYITNAATINMNTPGSKTLTISYTEGTITKTAAITITVNPKADTAPKIKTGAKITDKDSAGTYKVTSTDLEAPTVEYTGTTNQKKKTITIPEYVTYQGVKYKVTSVSAKSFKGNKKLTTIKIASSITKISDSAFEGCTSLKTVTIGKGLKTIGKNAFKNCKKLKTLTIKSNKLKTVGKNAFKGINAKCKIKVPAQKVKAYQKLMKKKGQAVTVKVVK